MAIIVEVSGSYKNTEKFLKNNEKQDSKINTILHKYGQQGLEYLRENTPKDSGVTANSWIYDIVTVGSKRTIVFTNTNINKGVNIAIILQYGHGTRNGGYVKGIDYLNPPAQKVFEKMANEIWMEVNKV